ncbi:peptide chain release factor H [Winogradskyella sp.]|jgi:peptide chain release factor|uniref:peptide chain release factor H n=1 Tax=Winogradskyella sp. TaxID=1883156 RepID=UPI0025CE027E|nr:peptide chain release factor H [Winogradskyella sp.]MCT4628527.1 peptide chain release factor H [Winogradskyella sp.]
METKIIQITSGRGPAECCWVVAQVLKLFIKALKGEGIAYTILNKEQGLENRTLQSVTLKIEGNALDVFLKPWKGTIQWIGKSKSRVYHKRKNWFIGFYEVENNQTFQIDEKDIIYQATRSSGPGGQHVNKVSSAIRAVHKPSNIQVLVMDSRSQHQNKKIAKQRLQEKVAELQLQALKGSVKHQWENHLQLQRGNPVKIFKGNDFKVQKKEKTYKSKRNQLKADLRKQLE